MSSNIDDNIWEEGSENYGFNRHFNIHSFGFRRDFNYEDFLDNLDEDDYQDAIKEEPSELAQLQPSRLNQYFGNLMIGPSPRDFDGLPELRHDIEYVCGLLDVINSFVKEKPSFAYRELKNAHEEVKKIEKSPLYLLSDCKEDIQAELAFLRLDLLNTYNVAYNLLEGIVDQ
tara:strand:- start:5793 stop:6308 length:516 start_codon:yes stop_codon:yes gene_type:complete